MDLKELSEMALQASKFSHSPYSHYRLGAALLCKNGKVYTGTNIENASYGLTNCAERTAIFKAVSSGDKEFEAIVIRSNDNSFPYPCGACRQVMAEFSDKDFKVAVANLNGEIKVFTLDELLPQTFVLEN